MLDDWEKLLTDPSIGGSERLELLGGMHMEAVASYGYQVKESQWVETIISKSPLTFGLVAGTNLDAEPETIKESIAALSKLGSMRGYRHMLTWAPNVDPQLTRDLLVGPDPRAAANLKILEENDLSFDLYINAHQLEDGIKMVKTVPNLRVILDHRSAPTMEDLKSLSYYKRM